MAAGLILSAISPSDCAPRLRWGRGLDLPA